MHCNSQFLLKIFKVVAVVVVVFVGGGGDVIFVVVIEPIFFGIQAGFSARDSNNAKLTKMLRWAHPGAVMADNNPDHYDVFSYVSKYVCLPR